MAKANPSDSASFPRASRLLSRAVLGIVAGVGVLAPTVLGRAEPASGDAGAVVLEEEEDAGDVGRAGTDALAREGVDGLLEEVARLRETVGELTDQLDEASEANALARRHVAYRRAVRRSRRQRGRVVYRRFCSSCHGRRGDGRGETARFLRVSPRDFTTGEYKWRTTPSGELPTDSDIIRTIERGVPGTHMPGWRGLLPRSDIRAVAGYLKTLSPRFLEEELEPEEDPDPPLRLPERVPRFGRAARVRGRALYALMQCWTCHGVTGDGRGPAASTLKDSRGNPIRAYDFTQGLFRGGRRAIDIYRTFSTGVSGTPMPAYHEALLVGREAFDDLSALTKGYGDRDIRAIREYVSRLPTTKEIQSMPEQRQAAYAARQRWDIVSYVLWLARGDETWRWFWWDPYMTK